MRKYIPLITIGVPSLNCELTLNEYLYFVSPFSVTVWVPTIQTTIELCGVIVVPFTVKLSGYLLFLVSNAIIIPVED